ncbi:hypothetical protein MHU86_6064 [Fragilaria crotonensis]|nr:hypothetical protein MHU86_6064 [Fragilaria crotonensis]
MFKILLLSLAAVSIAASRVDVLPLSALPDDINDADASLSSRQLNTLPTIAKLVDDNSSFDTLAAALKATGLDATLRGTGPFTVLAPTDKAFAKLGDATIQALLKDPDTLSDILLYHVISGKVLRSHLRNDVVKAANGDNLRVGVFKSGRVVINVRTNVTKFDVQASNGVVHVIDQVLTPPKDLVGTILSDKRFTTLAAAVKAAGLTSTLKAASKEFTIFAPTNKAFEALGQATVNSLLKNPSALKSILLYHTVSGSVLKSDLKNSGRVKTVQGSNVHYSNSGQTLVINDSKVTEANILAANGVIHAINKVLSIP